MRGCAQSHLLLASDGHPYVVKFQNNPQHIRVLANELLATLLALLIGLSAPPCEIVDVSPFLIDSSDELKLDLGNSIVPCRAGLQFGSRLVGGLMPGKAADYLPQEKLAEVTNLAEFAGILALDKWVCNSDGRQAVFTKQHRDKRYTASFIDQGYCFNAGEWRFIDAPLRGVYARNVVYSGVTGWDSFEPWLSRIQALDSEQLWCAAKTVPPQWYGEDNEAMEILIMKLLDRRERIPELITQFRYSSRTPFPNWR
jgi:hypothetical protein